MSKLAYILQFDMNEPTVRRMGRLLAPDAVNWDELNNDTYIPEDTALLLILWKHFVAKHVLKEDDACTAVAYFKDDITRYAEDIRTALASTDNDTIHKKIELKGLEVLGDRFLRFGMDSPLFDLQTQKTITMDEFAKSGGGHTIWSHIVMPIGLYMVLHGLEHNDAAKSGAETEATQCAD